MDGRPIARLFLATSGLLAWAVQFTVIYGLTSVVCARGYEDAALFGIGIVPLTIVATTLLALVATGFVLLWALQARRPLGEGARGTDRFLNSMTLIVSGLSLVAIAWQGLPALVVPACA